MDKVVRKDGDSSFVEINRSMSNIPVIFLIYCSPLNTSLTRDVSG